MLVELCSWITIWTEVQGSRAFRSPSNTSVHENLLLCALSLGKGTVSGLQWGFTTSTLSLLIKFEDNHVDDDTVTYTFQSEYAEEDIIETLDEIFSDKKAAETTALVSRVRIEPSSNVHECAVEIKVATANKSFCWPELKGINAKVIKEIKKIKKLK